MKIKIVEKANPADRKQTKFYANAINAGKKDIRTIAKDIAGRSSLTRGDIENVLSNFLDELPKYLNDGYSVQLSNFKRLIDIYSTSAKTVDALMKLELPSGVEVEIKV